MSAASQNPPLFSIRSERGRRSKMEDRHDIQLNFMELPLDLTEMDDIIPSFLPTPLKTKSAPIFTGPDFGPCPRGSVSEELMGLNQRARGDIQSFHLFAVFDGHGGFLAAEHCANKLAQNLKSTITRTLKKHALPITEIVRHKTVPTHVLLAEAINMAEFASSDFDEETETETAAQDTSDESCLSPNSPEDNAAIRTLFSTMSLGISNRCEFANEKRSIQTLVSKRLNELDLKLDNGLTSSQLIACFNDAFVMTDHQFDCKGGSEQSGTTALLAMISAQLLCFAHCGDCRGVLYRDGQILQVTREHSPNCADERERIEILGGRIIVMHAEPRVHGVLNMTRAIGDFGLKPSIIPNPEVTILRRSHLDEFVVLASDGLWNVLDNQDVCDLVNKCFARVESRGLGRRNASKVAAGVLVRKAMDNGASDNITVIVIDMRLYY